MQKHQKEVTMQKHQIQLDLFSSADDRVCTDERGLLVAFSEEISKPLFIESEGLWLMSIDGVAWVQAEGSEMGLSSGGEIEVFKAGNLNAWLVTEIMKESFPSMIGMSYMDKVFKAEIAGFNTLKISLGGFNGQEGEVCFELTVDGWIRR
jgi:hypothetical protein